ncbi:MAG: hypothetical protein ACTHQM_11400 [Thermoanaerobaculia bacterium]
MPLLPAVFQVLATSAACWGLWWLWTRFATESRATQRVIAGGFIIRGLAGAALFWISWLELPIARSLQTGKGLWFFAVDGHAFMNVATQAASEGLLAVFQLHGLVYSLEFVRCLALFCWFFGSVASVGLLLNELTFLLLALAIVRWAARNRIESRHVTLVLAAVSFFPSWILWSLQPLKDTTFLLLIVVFALLCDGFWRAWPDGKRAALHIAMMAATLYLIASIRWYYAMLAGAAALLLSATILRAPRRVLAIRAIALFVLTIAIHTAIVRGGAYYMPPLFLSMLEPSKRHAAGWEPRSDPQVVRHVFREHRQWFENRREAATHIKAGPTLMRLDAFHLGSTARKTIAGLSGIFLPQSLTNRLGLISVEGGRGLMGFTDVDSLCMLALLAIVVIKLARRGRSAWRDPLIVYLVIVTLCLTLSLAYTVTNLGALVRYRAMIVATLLLLTLVTERRGGDPYNPGISNRQAEP